MDTTYPLYYNGRAVSRSNTRQHGQERFSAEIMTYLDHLYRVAFHLARNDDEAQDCVQETCARALSAYSQFAPGSNMKAWLTRILYNFFLIPTRAKSAWWPPRISAISPRAAQPTRVFGIA